MNEKEQRAIWLAQIRKLQNSLDIGRGVIFSRKYSEEHNKLVDAAEDVALLLEEYYNADSLSEEQARQLGEASKKLSKLAAGYKDAKKSSDGYALEAGVDPKGKKVNQAKGDKRKRLEAADGLEKYAADMTTELGRITKSAGDREKAEPANSVGEEERNRRRAVSLKDLRETENKERSFRDIQAAQISSMSSYKSKVAEHEKFLAQEVYNKKRKESLTQGYNLHRTDIMGFSDDASFQKSYEKNRLKIYKSVCEYRSLEELKETDPVRFGISLSKLGMTEKDFTSMEDKINVIDMCGRYLDAKAELVSNPEYLKLNPEGRRALLEKSEEELTADIDALTTQPDSEENRKRIQAMESARDMKHMETAFGIKPQKAGTKYEMKGIQDNAVGENSSTKAALFTGYVDVGTKDISKLKTRKGFWQYFKDHFKLKGKSKDSAFKVKDNKTGEEKKKESADFLDASSNLAKGKFRIAKLGAKYKSDGGALNASIHVTGVTVKSSADMGVSFSASNLWENKVYLQASASATGLRGVAKGNLGYRKDWIKGDIRGEGNIGFANASALGGAGMIRYKDDDGKEHEGYGLSSELKAEAGVFEGSVHGGITIFGVRFGGKLSGRAISAGASGKFTATADHLSFGLGLSLGIGAGFEVSIDWTGLKNKYTAWKERRSQEAKLRENREQEKAEKRQKDENAKANDPANKKRGFQLR